MRKTTPPLWRPLLTRFYYKETDPSTGDHFHEDWTGYIKTTPPPGSMIVTINVTSRLLTSRHPVSYVLIIDVSVPTEFEENISLLIGNSFSVSCQYDVLKPTVKFNNIMFIHRARKRICSRHVQSAEEDEHLGYVKVCILVTVEISGNDVINQIGIASNMICSQEFLNALMNK
ncbi:hypothetical protein DPMN_061190 [Dreissena polymorpha]|uniref:Uncharacterized protein n=1 Tax=Dreissena polymorpha TaxID=45954 RepID=A0A9D4C750_DREPO|nr:hypothetical protein DPMN_061190 [Dreissena polymorpha]